MILLKRFIPVCTALFLLAGFEFTLAYQHLYWLFAAVVLSALSLASGSLLSWKFRRSEFWHLFLLPMSFVASSFLLLLFVSDSWLAQLLAFASAVLCGWYLENVFQYHFQRQRYQPYALENIASYLNLLVVFFFASSLFAMRVFLNISLFVLVPLGAVVSVALSFQVLWTSKVALSRAWIMLVVYGVIMFEIFGAVSILPTTFFVAGLLLAVPHYLMMNLARHSFRDQLDHRVLRRYAIIGSAALLVTLLSAPWG
ncbi:MAG: hypothetical protein HY566_01170 [Candidatus Kerfeldbacteria bacterium]|nr:hypothetical protein [Candidatus Kerfeldbacteria bacterium]